MAKYTTLLLDFNDRLERDSIRIPKNYKVNLLPYEYARDRFIETMDVISALAGNLWDKQLQEMLVAKVGESGKNHVMHVLIHNSKHPNNIKRVNREFLAEICYNKVISWNIFNNNSRVFVAKIDTEELFYVADTSMGVNKYYNSQVEQFIKTAMDTDATIFVVDEKNNLLTTLKFHKGEHSWDYKNEYWNEIVAEIMMTVSNNALSEELDPVIQDAYKDLMTKYSNLEMSERLDLVDYTTKFYYNYSKTVRMVDIETFKFMEANELLEEKVDVDDIQEQLEYLEDKIRKAYLEGRDTLVSELLKDYMELDATLSREYMLEHECGYNDSIDTDEDEDVEMTALNHIENEEIAQYTRR